MTEEIKRNPNLRPCKTCKKEVAINAKTCPQCGVEKPGITWKDNAIGTVVLLLIILLLGYCVYRPDTSEEAAQPRSVEKEISNQSAVPEPSNAETVETNEPPAAPLSPEEEFEKYGHSWGWLACEEFIKKLLIAPRTAKFPMLDTVSGTTRDGDTITVKAPIKAQNLYGNNSESEYVCKVKFLNYGEDGVHLEELTFTNPTILK